MNRLGGSSLIVVAIFLIIFGLFIGSDFISGLLEVLRWVFIIIGIVLGIIGVVQMLSGGRSRSSDY